MANAKGHIIGSMFFGTIYWILSMWTNDFGFLILTLVPSIFGGMMPDILEPATWPGHREVWHYLGGVLSIFPAILFRSTISGFFFGSFCIGYFSHFVLDIMT